MSFGRANFKSSAFGASFGSGDTKEAINDDSVDFESDEEEVPEPVTAPSVFMKISAASKMTNNHRSPTTVTAMSSPPGGGEVESQIEESQTQTQVQEPQLEPDPCVCCILYHLKYELH